MYKLVISDDEGRTTVVPLVRDEITIGRNDGNTIRLTERNVSRQHARLLKLNGSFVVEDLGSYNGVRLNGRRIEGDVTLNDGDRLLIGDYELAFEEERPEEAWDDATPVQLVVAPSRLVVLTDPSPGAEFSLTQPRQKIGRSEAMQIFVNHKSVSHEHAEITVENGIVRIEDLQSANGVRVNGKHVTVETLAPGDLVEVGEVLFRFEPPAVPSQSAPPAVAPPDVDPIEPERSETSKAPLIALGALGVAAAAVALFALSGDGNEVTVQATTPAVNDTSKVERAIAPDQVLDEATEAQAGADGAAAAVQQVDVDPAQLAFDSAQAALADGRIDDAYALIASIDPTHELAGASQARRIVQRFVASHLTKARAATYKDPDVALQHAGQVLAVPGLSKTNQTQANRVITRIERRRAASERAAKAKAARAAQTAARPATTKPTAKSGGGLDAARQCLRHGDNPCVIRALENGRARSPAALALLIETYRTVGDKASATRQMRAFVKRYPNDRRAERYRQMIE